MQYRLNKAPNAKPNDDTPIDLLEPFDFPVEVEVELDVTPVAVPVVLVPAVLVSAPAVAARAAAEDRAAVAEERAGD